MPQFEIPSEVYERSIDWLDRKPEIMQFLRDKGMVTVEDVLDQQDEIPEKYMLEIKSKLIFDV